MSRLGWTILLGTVAVAGCVLGIVGLAAQAAPEASRARTDATLYIAPSGSDHASCTKTAPCASMGRAFAVAQPGQQVLVGAGSYGDQLLGSTSDKGGAPIVFRPEGGAVSMQSLDVNGASRVIVHGLTFKDEVMVENEQPEQAGSSFITLSGDTAETLRLVGRISHITVSGGSYGNAVNTQPQIKKYNGSDPDSAAPTDILLDGVAFHDYRRSDPTVHTECLQIMDGTRITVRRSRFWNCDGTGDIGITPQSTIVDLTMENNFIGGGGDNRFGVQIGMLLRNFVFRYNSSSQSVFFADSSSGGPYTFVGNYMPSNPSLCKEQATFRQNVLRGDPCGSTDIGVSDLQFVNPGAADLHLAAGANALGRGLAGDAPATDIEGDMRPTRLAPDAGADQQETARIVLGRSLGEIVVGQPLQTATTVYGQGSVRRARLNGHPVQQVVYRRHGGTTWLYADNGVIVGAGTTSSYYETVDGLGPTATLPAPFRGYTWTGCLKAFTRTIAGSVVRVASRAGSKGGAVSAMSFLRSRYAGCPR